MNSEPHDGTGYMKNKYKVYLAIWMFAAAALYGVVTTFFMVQNPDDWVKIGLLGTLLFMIVAITGSLLITRLSKNDPNQPS